MARNERKQRFILTDQLGYRNYGQTKDLVRQLSRAHNILKVIIDTEHKYTIQERSALIMVWTSIRSILANIMSSTFNATS